MEVVSLYTIKASLKHFYFTRVTAKLEACMLAVDLSVLPPAELVPNYTARWTEHVDFKENFFKSISYSGY